MSFKEKLKRPFQGLRFKDDFVWKTVQNAAYLVWVICFVAWAVNDLTIDNDVVVLVGSVVEILAVGMWLYASGRVDQKKRSDAEAPPLVRVSAYCAPDNRAFDTHQYDTKAAS